MQFPYIITEWRLLRHTGNPTQTKCLQSDSCSAPIPNVISIPSLIPVVSLHCVVQPVSNHFHTGGAKPMLVFLPTTTAAMAAFREVHFLGAGHFFVKGPTRGFFFSTLLKGWATCWNEPMAEQNWSLLMREKCQHFKIKCQHVWGAQFSLKPQDYK